MIQDRYVTWGSSGCTIREIAAYGEQRAAIVGPENVYNFTIGNPSVDPPPCVEQTIRELMDTTPATALYAYAPAAGLPQVRQTMADHLNRCFGTAYRAQDIFMTSGASSALSILTHALLSEGDEVIALAPFFSEYQVFAEAAGASFKVVPGLPRSFQLDMTALEEAITPATAMLILNSPNNPSGVVLSRRCLADLAALLESKQREYGHPIYIVADEPYRELVYNGVEVPFLPSLYPNAIYCYSFSKSMSIPGERVGFLAVSPAAADYDRVMAAVAGANRALGYICVSTLFQRVAAACIGQTADISEYEKNRDVIYNGLKELGYGCVQPDGAFYLFVECPGGDANAFCQRAMAYDLLLVPGDDFGCPGYARLAYCVPRERLERSLPLFAKLAEEYGLK